MPPHRAIPFFFLFVLSAASSPRIETVRNEKVIVSEISLEPGQTLTAREPGALVYRTDGSIEISPEAGSPQRIKVNCGDTVFLPPQAGSVRNVGAAEIRLVRVDFLEAAKQGTWGSTGLPPNYKLLFENQYARAYDIRIRAGTREPQHTHHDRVVVCLSGATLKHLMPDGREESSTLKTGESVWRRGGTHIGQNLGSTDLWAIAIEPK